MPILTSETNLYPVNLLETPHLDRSCEKCLSDWWVFYTRARQEKSLSRDLLQREIPFYLPLVPRRLLIRGRPVHSLVPLFTGYVFVFGSDDDRVRALMTNRVAQVFPVMDAEQLRGDLLKIQLLIESGAALTVESQLAPHQHVRIRAGALAGLEGSVIRRKNETRLMVWVTMLQQGVSLEIDDYLLEPVG
ncbi:MAG TPA: transcription termination/antitermination NusG family protein [Pirellulales bacterium]|nr:transcription termination/antitermination NusG family protein [Pirellulales bacterium]